MEGERDIDSWKEIEKERGMRGRKEEKEDERDKGLERDI